MAIDISSLEEEVGQALVKFTDEVQDWLDRQLPEAVLNAQRGLAIKALDSIVYRTPVDTGNARGQWQTSLVGSNESVLPVEVARTRDARSDGVATIMQLAPFGTVTLFNNAAYILPLEGGHSKRSADGMVRPTIEELRESFFV